MLTRADERPTGRSANASHNAWLFLGAKDQSSRGVVGLDDDDEVDPMDSGLEGDPVDRTGVRMGLG
ncbi:MAG TPA: hypothetical protein VED59_01400 [Acidimicrobiales bacterium]|nr:hypothetical protein [Acidimicrobiales bacterium]